MNGTTSILDLPTDPTGGGNISNNINITATEPNHAGQGQNNQALTLDQTTISQIVNGLQQASVAGATLLPSRDIPRNTDVITQDPNVQPNYIPPLPQNMVKDDYIKDYETNDEIMNSYHKNAQRNSSIDEMYNEIQVPLLLSILYFLFQLPFFKKFLFTYLPILFSNDGNLNINGFLFTSILFGLVFHMLNKITTQFGTF
jgi:hypothetical protein